MAGRRGADHVQPGTERAVGGTQGVAVHRRYVGGRLCQPGDDRRGADTPPGGGQPDCLHRGRGQAGEYAGAGFFNADHDRALS